MTDITATMAEELALAQGVCIRPMVRRVVDRETGQESIVTLPCRSTRTSACPPCAQKAKRLRVQQCREGWHRTDDPLLSRPETAQGNAAAPGQPRDMQQSRRVRSTQRREDVEDLPVKEMAHTSIGRAYSTPTGQTYRPSMFVTLTLPSYGKVDPEHGFPLAPQRYDYRRQALDAMLFPRLLNQWWTNLRRCAGYCVQYFSVLEPQRRLAPHMHAAIRGTIPRATLKAVMEATCVQIWWPSFKEPVYPTRDPLWNGREYVDPTTKRPLPTWEEALDRLDEELANPDPGQRPEPAHVLRFGKQFDVQGIIAPSRDADRAVGYLTKYLTKSVGETCVDPTIPRAMAHAARLHQELAYLPCSERCANWLRYGVQPKGAHVGQRPGHCPGAAHEWENLGMGGRRVLVSRNWSGKTLSKHHEDRLAAVRETLANTGVEAPEQDRLATSRKMPDGTPRFQWQTLKAEGAGYIHAIMRSVEERQRWREQYNKAKQPVDNVCATSPPQPSASGIHTSGMLG